MISAMVLIRSLSGSKASSSMRPSTWRTERIPTWWAGQGALNPLRPPRMWPPGAAILWSRRSCRRKTASCIWLPWMLLQTGSGSEGPFGLAFDFNGKSGKYKMITLDPAEGLLQLSFNEGGTLIAEKAVQLEAGRDYTLFR